MIVKEWASKRPCGDVNKYREGGCRCELCRAAVAQVQREWRAANPETNRRMHRRNRLKRNYGLAPEDVDRMLEQQNGCCAICGGPPGTEGIFMVDHCHETNRVRGLLCRSCNTKLGWFEKRPGIILAYVHKEES